MVDSSILIDYFRKTNKAKKQFNLKNIFISDFFVNLKSYNQIKWQKSYQ